MRKVLALQGRLVVEVVARPGCRCTDDFCPLRDFRRGGSASGRFPRRHCALGLARRSALFDSLGYESGVCRPRARFKQGHPQVPREGGTSFCPKQKPEWMCGLRGNSSPLAVGVCAGESIAGEELEVIWSSGGGEKCLVLRDLPVIVLFWNVAASRRPLLLPGNRGLTRRGYYPSSSIAPFLQCPLFISLMIGCGISELESLPYLPTDANLLAGVRGGGGGG